MKLIKPMLFSGICLLGNLLSLNAFSFEPEVIDIGIKKIEAQDISFEQAYLCPYPIKLEARVYNDLDISGLKKFSYRWVLNDEVIDTGRFEAIASSYGNGYDIQNKVAHVGEESVQESGINTLVSVFSKKSPPNQGWYQFMVLPAGESNWYDAVKSNKASYTIQCKL